MGIGKATFASAGQISQHLLPGAYSRIDSVKGAGGFVSAKNGCIMGASKGGTPLELLKFNKVSEAVQTLKSGDLMDAVRLAFNPGGSYIPQTIYAMRVNSALQGSAYLLETATQLVKITSVDYGLDVNQIKVLMETGTTGKKVTISYKSNDDEVFDNLYRSSLTITHATATITIVNNSGSRLLTGSVDSLSANLETFATVGELASYINDQTGYTAVPTAGQENALAIELDAITAVSAVGGLICQSTMEAIINGINAGSAKVQAEDVSGVNDREIPDNLALTYLTGGSEGTYSTTEWTNALIQMESEDIQLISTPDTESSIHSAIKSHCESMSAVNGRKERQFLVGAPIKTGVIATDIASAVTASQTLNSKNGLYTFNGGTQYDVDGVITSYCAGFSACMLMGIHCATALNMPLTFKELNFIELEWKLSNSQLETLVENGVAPINYSTVGQPHCVRQVNTYQTADLKWNEFSMVTEMFFASRDLRSYLESLFVGNPGTYLTGGVLKGVVQTKLNTYTTTLGIFTKDTAGIAFWNIQVTIMGDIVEVDYDANITAPINFLFITQHMHIVTSST